MSMQEEAAGGGAAAADMLSDASYVNSILSSLPGVDLDDRSIQQALNSRPPTDHDGG